MKLGKKIIACDIDGTLVTTDKKITPKTRETLVKFQRQGGVLVIASGRPVCGIEGCAKELELDKFGGYIMAYNGGSVVNVKTKEVVCERFVDKEILPKAVSLAKEFGINLMTYQDKFLITEDDSEERIEIEKRINGLDVKVVDSLYDYIDFNIPKLLGIGAPEVIEKLEKVFKKELEGVNVFRSEPYFLEVTPMGVAKGDVLEELAKKLGYTIDDTAAFGDGYNDVNLIDRAAFGVAMDNACDAVKEVADYVTDTNDNDGVAKAVEKFILLDD